MQFPIALVLATLSFGCASAAVFRHSADPKTPAWMDPANPRCGVIEPWSKHKPYEPIVGKDEKAKESQCHACKVRACNAGLPPPGEVGGCRCISYKDAAGNYATDCKNLLNKKLPMKYEKCGAVRDCEALEGQCVSAKFKMDSAKEAPWQKADWKGANGTDEKKDSKMPAWMDPANPKCGVTEPWSKHKPYEPIVGKDEKAKESQCHACKVRACNAGLPPPGEVGGCRCISYKDAAGNYATDCKNLLNKKLPMKYEKCGAVRDCEALEGQCVSAKFKMDSAKEAPWQKADWKGANGTDEKKDSKMPAWMDPANPKCGVTEPWSKHKPYEPIVGKDEKAKESQCHACKVRACNAGLPPPGEVGGCRCISYKDAAGNYATDCKNLLNKKLPMKYEKCGAVRDCKALEGQCVSAKFKMDSAKEAPWQKADWKGAKGSSFRSAGISMIPMLLLMAIASN